MKPFLFSPGQPVTPVAKHWVSAATGLPVVARHRLPVVNQVYHVSFMDQQGGTNYIALSEFVLDPTLTGVPDMFAEYKFAPVDAEVASLVEELVREEEVYA